MKIKTQAEKLATALYQCVRGSNIVFRMTHSPTGKGFDVYASWLGASVTSDNTPIAYIHCLSLDNVPYLLNKLAATTKTSIYMSLTANVKPSKNTVYTLATKYSRAYRISSELANSLHESAIRDDDLKVTSSSRIAYVSLSDYIDVWQYSTIDNS